MNPIYRWMPWVACAALGVTLLATFPIAGANGQDGQQQGEQPAREPADFRKLREWLPAELAGLKRTDAQGQRFGTGQDRISMASGTYNDENHEKSITVTVTDFIATANPSDAAFWKDQELDQESDNGYMRTRKIQGLPAYEIWDGNGGSGTLMVLVADRMVVSVGTYGIDKQAFEKLPESLDFKKLAAIVNGDATTRPTTGTAAE